MSINRAMIELRAFFQKHNLPEPDGIEFRFGEKVDAFRFDAVVKQEFDPSTFEIDPADPGRVLKIRGFKIEPTYRRHGAAYATTVLPAWHPAGSERETD